MVDSKAIEKLMMRLRGERDEAEALASGARETLSRLSLVPLAELNPDEVENAADDLAANARKLQLYDRVLGDLRGLLY